MRQISSVMNKVILQIAFIYVEVTNKRLVTSVAPGPALPIPLRRLLDFSLYAYSIRHLVYRDRKSGVTYVLTSGGTPDGKEVRHPGLFRYLVQGIVTVVL